MGVRKVVPAVANPGGKLQFKRISGEKGITYQAAEAATLAEAENLLSN